MIFELNAGNKSPWIRPANPLHDAVPAGIAEAVDLDPEAGPDAVAFEGADPAHGTQSLERVLVRAELDAKLRGLARMRQLAGGRHEESSTAEAEATLIKC